MLSPSCLRVEEGDSGDSNEDGTEDSASSSSESLSEEDTRKKESKRKSWIWRGLPHPQTQVPVSSENPFANQAHWTCYEIFKLIVVGLTLFPVRLILVLVFSICMFILIISATLGLSLEEREGCFCFNGPLARWRRALLRPCAALSRGILWCVGFWCINFVDHRDDRTQMPNIIVVAPHMTFVDMLVVCWTFPPFVSFLADATILRAPGGHRIAIATQTIFINMRDSASRKRAAELLEGRALPEWGGLRTAIFPEGRITNGKKLIQFKPGAFKAGRPVLPVLLRYPYRHFDPSSTGSNWGPLWFIRIMTQFVNHCTIEVLPPYEPCEAEVANPAVYAQEVRSLMAAELGVGTTEHTVDDAFLYRAARQARIGSDFQVASMRRLFNVDLKQLMEWLRTFQKVDKDGSGIIDRAEFRTVIGTDPEAADRLFDFFDTDESGTMEYREFVQGLALLSGQCSAESQAQLAFLLYDVDGRGTIPKSRLRFALDRTFQQQSAHELWPLQASSSIGSRGRASPGSGASPGRRLVKQATVASVLLSPEALPDLRLDSRNSVASASMDSLSEEIDYETFCQIVEQHPQVLERALEPIKRHFHKTLGV